MSASHANIPIFIPHLGCPNQCVFCDQRTISGVGEFDESKVRELIEDSLKTLGDRKAEIAFFGGSFTGIDRALMIRLLDTAEEYVKLGAVSGIRMSTRPDYIDSEIMRILSGYSVSEIELGVQSMSSRVLRACRRGHTPDDTRRAAKMIADCGFGFVGQMMIGLPSSTPEDEIACATEICDMGAVGARIYPTIVFRNTELEKMCELGSYIPLEVDEAAERSAAALSVFEERGVRCLRVGLCDSEMLHGDERYFDGPVHPAMGELAQSALYRNRIELAADRCVSSGRCMCVEVAKGRVSAAVGQHRSNRLYLEKKFNCEKIRFIENPELRGYDVKVYPVCGEVK